MSHINRGLPLASSRTEQVFPTLTPVQIRRIAVHGQIRATQSGEVLVEQGAPPYRSLWWSPVNWRFFTPRARREHRGQGRRFPVTLEELTPVKDS
jgi:hypothetical protein